MIYNIEHGSFSLSENDRDKQLSDSKDIFSKRRCCAFFNPKKDFDQIYRLLALFGIDDTNIGKCKPIDDNWLNEKDLIIAENVNPYIMKLNWRCVVYFGDDMPVVKSKTVKTKNRTLSTVDRKYNL